MHSVNIIKKGVVGFKFFQTAILLSLLTHIVLVITPDIVKLSYLTAAEYFMDSSAFIVMDFSRIFR